MTQPSVGKQILIAEDEQVSRSLLDSWFSSLGATTVLAAGGVDVFELLGGFTSDLMVCDIAIPRMNGFKLLERICNRSDQIPVLVISATENIADITKALRLGVEDVPLKPIKDLNRSHETVSACLYPSMFSSRIEEEEGLFRDWDVMADSPAVTARLSQEPQPPVQQMIPQCRVNYHQLVATGKLGLVFDIIAPPEGGPAFYCLNVTRAGHNDVLAVLLLCALFNGLLQRQLARQNQWLPELGVLSKRVSHLLCQADLPGQFPLLVGCYHCELKNLILASAGLNVTLNTGEHQV